MPIYEYNCKKCGETFEIMQKFSDDPLKTHNQNEGCTCKGKVQKLISRSSVQFKGSEWYETDYKDKS